MSSPFLPSNGRLRPPKRNKRDLSRSSLFTSDWGKLYPFFCQEVIPGASYKIDASVGFRAMQTKFPLQSRIRTAVYFCYVRNRTLWNGWEDWIFKTKGENDGVVAPYLQISSMSSSNSNVLRTGSLGDALGVVTTQGAAGTNVFHYTPRYKVVGIRTANPQTSWGYAQLTNYLNSRIGQELDLFPIVTTTVADKSAYCGYGHEVGIPDDATNLNDIVFATSATGTASVTYFFALLNYGIVIATGSSDAVTASTINLTVPQSIKSAFSSSKEYYNTGWSLLICSVSSSGQPIAQLTGLSSLDLYYSFGSIVQPSSSPFIGLTPSIPLNALPFRAYTSICNYYFRNDLNSPYMLGGVPQYNEFIPTHDGGADTNVYDFHFHNWELDRFVSALPTPQFGEAPLVGLTYRVGAIEDQVDFTFKSDGEDDYHARLGVVDDKITSIVSADPDLPSSNLRNLMDMVNAGFSINTLRDVNSFQRFLENCQRRGLRYRNQIQSHFGVNVDYPDIDVPQYIGGFSDWAQIGQVTNMAELPDAGLGDYVGTISGSSQSKHSITCYTPEHGFIIGIYCIYPSPVYSQSLPKYLLKTSPFDYFTPEFGKIGKVPIHYSEISPLQTDSSHQLTDVFGYQVPWYDYLDAQDTAHGDFRTTLRDFLVQRLWDAPPVLCEDFVRVNPTQLNDVFTTRNIADAYGSNSRFLCSSYCHVTALLPIPVHGVPSLE